MQKLVKKNLDEKASSKSKVFNSVTPVLVAPKSQLKSKDSKRNKLKLKLSKADLIGRRICQNLLSGRPFNDYKLKRKIKLLRLTVRVTPNNVFCTLKDTKTDNLFKSVSAGSYNFNVTKKGVRHYSRQIVSLFLKDLRETNFNFNRPLVTKIIAPVSLRRPLLDLFKKSLFKRLHAKKTLFIDIPAKKVFNGCRPRKQIRKKRKGLRLFK